VAGAEVVKTAAKSKNVANDASDAGKNEKGENSSDGGEDEDEDYDKYLDNLEQGLDDSDWRKENIIFQFFNPTSS